VAVPDGLVKDIAFQPLEIVPLAKLVIIPPLWMITPELVESAELIAP
jgi:hypothetical protein